MSYWIFKCDPKKYDLGRRLVDLANPSTTWLVTRYKKEITAGDTAFLMDTGIKRAIRAILRVDSSPSDIAELPHEQDYWAARDTEIRCRVLGTLTRRLRLPVQELKEIEELQDLSIFKGFQQGTNFPVSEVEGRILLSVAERWDSIQDLREGLEDEQAGRVRSLADIIVDHRNSIRGFAADGPEG